METLNTEETKSQAQRGLIFGKREKYGNIKNTPSEWKWVWNADWENTGSLPQKVSETDNNTQTEDNQFMGGDNTLTAYNNIKEINKPMKKLSELFNEKWDKDVDVKDTGENTDKTIAQLKKEKQGADTKTKQQKNFAIRAKQGWKKGGIKESDAYTNAYGGANKNFSFFIVGEDGTEFTVDEEGMDINDAYKKVAANYPDANSIRLNDASMGDLDEYDISYNSRGDAPDASVKVASGNDRNAAIQKAAWRDKNFDVNTVKDYTPSRLNPAPQTTSEGETAVGNPAALYDMDKEGGQKSSAYVSKNMPSNGIPVMENKDQENECSTVRKKIRYKMTEDQKKMFDELRMIKESMRRLDGNKQLLY